MNPYPDIEDPDFNSILEKYEFSKHNANNKIKSVYQEPHQLLLRNYISKYTPYHSVLLYYDVGVGKCHKKDTKILMYDGSIKMVQDIQEGELLMGDDSTSRKVISLARGTDKMYKIIPHDKSEPYVVNKEHILCLRAPELPRIKNSKTKIIVEWIENNKFMSKQFAKDKLEIANQFYENIQHEQILEISVENYLQLSKPKKQLLFGYRTDLTFFEKELNLHPYLLGFWLSSKQKYCLQFKNEIIKNYIEKSILQHDLYLESAKLGYRLNSTTKKNLFTNCLKEHHLLKEKCIPMIYKCNSREHRLQLLAGILDNSGQYMAKKDSFQLRFNKENSKLIDDIIYLARSLGLIVTKSNKTHFTKLVINGKLSEIPTTSFENVKDTPCNLTYNISVVEEPEDEYYGFTLDNNCRYLLNDFTVTHNTCAAISIAEGFKEFVTNKNRKIFVLVKNKNIQLNFMNELQSSCAGDEYFTEEDKQQLETATPFERKTIIQNIRKRIQKIYRILTYGTFKNKVDSGDIRSFSNSVVIIDEAHNVTNNENYDYLMKILSNSYNYRIVLLTATPIFDNPKEIAEISNLLNANEPDKLFPIRNKLYLRKFMTANPSDYINYKILRAGITQITERGEDLLKKSMFGKVSFVASNKDTNPIKIERGDPIIKDRIGSTHVILCEMSDYQYTVYKQAVEEDTSKFTPEMLEENESGQQIAIVAKDRYKGVNLYKNSNDASTMVYPNNLYGKAGYEQLMKNPSVLTTDLQMYSAKLFNLLKNIKKSPGNIFIYSNYTTAGGTSLIEKLLLKNGFAKYSSSSQSPLPKYVIFDRESAENRDKLRKIFNDPDNKNGEQIKIVVGSPVMSEGITLKNVRQVHILEPSWNMSRINQIIGRAVRNYSHHDLPPVDRTVEIYKYVSVYSKGDSDDFFIDKEKYILSEEKDRANKTVERILKQTSFDCTLMKSRNIEKGVNGSPECDYVNCEFDCLVQRPSTNNLDKSTYNLYLNFFEKYLVDFVTQKIQELFNEYYAWNIEDIRSIIQSEEPQVNDEIIYHVLSRFVEEQIKLSDKFNRIGFLVNDGDLYIFNPNEIDIKSSLFSKVLDFSVKTNKFKLTDYINKIGISLVSKREKAPLKEKVSIGIKPSEKDEEYNTQLKAEYYKNYIDTEDIIIKQPILGSYIDRNTGEMDGKIRFISPRQQKPSNEEIELGLTDARFMKTGMAGKSFKKDILQQIAKYDLQIPDVEKLYIKTDSLIKIIEKTLKEKNLLMKPIPE